MLAANNLSDLADKPAGRANLGVTIADIVGRSFVAAPYGTAARSTLQRLGEEINVRELYEGEANHVPAFNRAIALLNASTATSRPRS
jgi:hypothetical protein